MQNIILIVHLLLALGLIIVVLMQRSEGGALGMGGGGGGGLVSSRGAATALSKLTWALGIAFLCTSILLTAVTDGGRGGSILDQIGNGEGILPTAPVETPATTPTVPEATLPATAD
ncbi:preprotein translocase subunit SecG [Rhodobacteraceae bacterium NNCM2]|nr:preprotein translocase subunit SecG [Coraliihabitans acroporae]